MIYFLKATHSLVWLARLKECVLAWNMKIDRCSTLLFSMFYEVFFSGLSPISRWKFVNWRESSRGGGISFQLEALWFYIYYQINILLEKKSLHGDIFTATSTQHVLKLDRIKHWNICSLWNQLALAGNRLNNWGTGLIHVLQLFCMRLTEPWSQRAAVMGQQRILCLSCNVWNCLCATYPSPGSLTHLGGHR